jgi:site-specific DNA-methyltransferase (adenine-specific)
VTEPYYSDDLVTLYHGDMRDVLPSLDMTFDAALADPPYKETGLDWDVWPDGWPEIVARYTNRLWCFGTLGMFMDHATEFNGVWKRPRSIVWRKRNGTGFAADFFKVVHEQAGYFYRGPWAQAHEPALREAYHGPDKHARARSARTPHTGDIGAFDYADDGTRLIQSVIEAPSVRGGLHPTQKPVKVVDLMIRYAVPVGGLLLSPFAGSGTDLWTARSLGLKAVGIEKSESMCEKAAARLSADDLFVGSPS